MSAAFAIAAGVVGVAGAATSAGMGMAAASKAAKAQGAASKAMQKRTNKATETFNQQQAQATKTFNRQQKQLRQQVAAIDPNIPVKEFSLPEATAESINAANQITANTIEQLRKIDPQSVGAVERAYSTLAQGQNLAAQLMAEGAPLESKQAVLKELARTGGAGFNIATAGRGMAVPSAPQASYAKLLGEQDIKFRLMGAELGQSLGNTAFNWRNFSAAFLQPVGPLIQAGLQGRGQNIDVAQTNIRNRMAQAEMISNINAGIFGAQRGLAQDIYAAQTNQAQRLYGLQQENIQTALARDQAAAQIPGDIGKAGMSALGGISGSLGQLAMAQGAGGSGGIVSGFGGKQYAPQTSATGGQYYAPIGSTVYG